jgi:hypothetical protein
MVVRQRSREVAVMLGMSVTGEQGKGNEWVSGGQEQGCEWVTGEQGEGSE